MKSIYRRLDALYSWTDRRIRAGRLEEIERILGRLRTKDIDILLGFLTATLPAKSKLPSRRRIYEMATDRLMELKETDPTILQGLQS